MLINELSKRSGVSVHTLRYYENLGLILGKTDPEVTSNNYKNYDESLIEKLNWIIAAKKAGFTLAEIKTLLQHYFDKDLSIEEKVGIVNGKIKEIESKISQLKEVKSFLLKAKQDIENGFC